MEAPALSAQVCIASVWEAAPRAPRELYSRQMSTANVAWPDVPVRVPTGVSRPPVLLQGHVCTPVKSEFRPGSTDTAESA